jgi:hypothetical protein
VNLRSQYNACSYGQLIFSPLDPTNPNWPSPGVYDIQVSASSTADAVLFGVLFQTLIGITSCTVCPQEWMVVGLLVLLLCILHVFASNQSILMICSLEHTIQMCMSTQTFWFKTTRYGIETSSSTLQKNYFPSNILTYYLWQWHTYLSGQMHKMGECIVAVVAVISFHHEI